MGLFGGLVECMRCLQPLNKQRLQNCVLLFLFSFCSCWLCVEFVGFGGLFAKVLNLEV